MRVHLRHVLRCVGHSECTQSMSNVRGVIRHCRCALAHFEGDGMFGCEGCGWAVEAHTVCLIPLMMQERMVDWRGEFMRASEYASAGERRGQVMVKRVAKGND